MARKKVSDTDFKSARKNARKLVDSIRQLNVESEKERPELAEHHVGEYDYYVLEFKLVEQALRVVR